MANVVDLLRYGLVTVDQKPQQGGQPDPTLVRRDAVRATKAKYKKLG